MKLLRIIAAVCALCCAGGIASAGAQIDCDATYCFTAGDFSGEEQLTGICITGLPAAETGTVMLGNRVLRAGDILTVEQVEEMTFLPLRTQEDTQATVTYLPIYENRVDPAASMTISIRGREDKAPVAEDSALETYKNIPNEGMLKAYDPEGAEITYTLVRAPKRGEVTVNADGSFTYTPKKNKVGVDSFVYTATDPAGNVSRQATVTVQILKPTDSRQYADTVGMSCQFEAQWLRNTGLFTGESVSGENCFCPDKAVSRGDFLAMLVKALDIPADQTDYTDIPEDVPQWLRPYVGAALRSGLLEGCPETETGGFEADTPVTGAEAAVMAQNALSLSVCQTATLTGDVPAWAADAVTVLQENGVSVSFGEILTRAQAADMLYKISRLALTAPGTAVFQMN